MSALTDLRTRIRTQYLDPQGLVLDDDTLDEGFRSALEEISRIYGTALTLEGLDGATVTTLEPLDLPCLLTGVTAFGLKIILLNRLKGFSTSLTADAELMTAEHHFKERFKTFLEELRMTDLQRSEACPHIGWEWCDLAPWEVGYHD